MPSALLVFCAAVVSAAAPGPLATPYAAAAFRGLPLRFEPNVGQADARARFLARGAGPDLTLSEDGDAVWRGGTVLRLRGARRRPRASGERPLPGRSHYFLGRDPSAWRTEIPHFGAVRYEAVYPGIDLVFHGAPGGLEYDFEVAPDADPSRIRVGVRAPRGALVDEAGNLVVASATGPLVQPPPLAYQESGGRREPVPVQYELRRDTVRFRLGPYDRRRPLVIDPVLSFSSYFGGNHDDSVSDAGYDRDGNILIAGSTTHGGPSDGFVAKIRPETSTLIYVTYLGGANQDNARSLSVDAFGNAVVGLETQSANLPVVGAVQATFAGGWDAYVAKLSPSGSTLAFATYLGGSSFDLSPSVATDRAGNVYVAGSTYSTDFPLQHPFQPALAGSSDFFLAKLDARGSQLQYSTYLGGPSAEYEYGLGVDASGRAVVTGFTGGSSFPLMNPWQPTSAGFDDAVIAKFAPDGQSLVYSTFLGGSLVDQAQGLAVDPVGNAYVVGHTQSANFPVANSVQVFAGWEDAFVSKISPDGLTLVYSTFLGGHDLDRPYAVTVDSAGNAYVGGETDSRDFPVLNAIQPAHAGGRYDGFVASFSPGGAPLRWSTYIGGGSDDTVYGLAAGRAGDVALGGFTASTNWPLVRPFRDQAQLWEGFAARISAGAMTPVAIATDNVPGPDTDANGVLDPGEAAVLIPGWRYNAVPPLPLTGQATAFTGPGVATFSILDAAASYGTVPGGGLIDCFNGTGDCYRVRIDAPLGRPLLHWDATLTESLSNGELRPWPVHVGRSFVDVDPSNPYYRFVETLLHTGLTSGCGGESYCPGLPTERQQMAVFVLVAQDGTIPPPACVAGQELFSDVAATSGFCRFIEELARRGVVGGCVAGRFCPTQPVSRQEMAVFALATREGPTFRPPACVGGGELFADVPASNPFCAWIEELARRGVVSGCGAGQFCPTSAVARDQMAVFIAATFRLSLYAV